MTDLRWIEVGTFIVEWVNYKLSDGEAILIYIYLIGKIRIFIK